MLTTIHCSEISNSQVSMAIPPLSLRPADSCGFSSFSFWKEYLCLLPLHPLPPPAPLPFFSSFVSSSSYPPPWVKEGVRRVDGRLYWDPVIYSERPPTLLWMGSVEAAPFQPPTQRWLPASLLYFSLEVHQTQKMIVSLLLAHGALCQTLH